MEDLGFHFILTWLTASSAFRRNSAIFSSVWRLISLITADSWWCDADPPCSPPRCCSIDIARLVFSTIPLMHDNIVWILRHSSSPLPLPDDVPFTWLPPPALTRLPRDGVSVFIDRRSRSRSSRLLCCYWKHLKKKDGKVRWKKKRKLLLWWL